MPVPLFRVALVGLLAACATYAAPAPPAALTYRFPKGVVLRYVDETKSKMTWAVRGEEYKADFLDVSEQTWKGIAPVEGLAHITKTVDRVRHVVDGYDPIGKGEFDSKDGKLPDTPYFERTGPVLKAKVGKTTALSITPAGKLKLIKAPEAVRDEVKKLNDKAVGEGLQPGALGVLVAQGDLILPNYTAGKGKAWEHTKSAKVPGGTFTTRTEYVPAGAVKRDGKELEVIRIKSLTDFKGDGSERLRLRSTESSGTAYFDKAAGRLVEKTVTTTLEIEFKIDDEPHVQKIQLTRTLKLVK
jgi:hypothetical protein